MERQTNLFEETENRRNSRWTNEEDDLLIRYIKARPQNLNYCFLMVAEITGRTKSAVSAHWYQRLSKRPDLWLFITASPHHVSRNRKNSMGEESSESVWRRILRAIRNIC